MNSIQQKSSKRNTELLIRKDYGKYHKGQIINCMDSFGSMRKFVVTRCVEEGMEIGSWGKVVNYNIFGKLVK